MGNVDIKRLKGTSPFRKVAIGTWQTSYDPSIYGGMRFRMDKATDFIKSFRKESGKKLTVTHLVIKALAHALATTPEANAVLRWNKIYLRQSVDISVLVVMKDHGKIDLSAAKLTDVDNKSLAQIIDELEEHAARIRARKDKHLEQTRRSMQLVPFMLINGVLKFLAFLMYTLNLNLSLFGLPKDPFGGAAVTSIGSLGLDVGYVPLVPYSRVPIWVAPGEVKQEAVVEDGKVIAAPTMNVSATFDHRIVDGAHAADLVRGFREVMDDPAQFFASESSKV